MACSVAMALVGASIRVAQHKWLAAASPRDPNSASSMGEPEARTCSRSLGGVLIRLLVAQIALLVSSVCSHARVQLGNAALYRTSWLA